METRHYVNFWIFILSFIPSLGYCQISTSSPSVQRMRIPVGTYQFSTENKIIELKSAGIYQYDKDLVPKGLKNGFYKMPAYCNDPSLPAPDLFQKLDGVPNKLIYTLNGQKFEDQLITEFLTIYGSGAPDFLLLVPNEKSSEFSIQSVGHLNYIAESIEFINVDLSEKIELIEMYEKMVAEFATKNLDVNTFRSEIESELLYSSFEELNEHLLLYYLLMTTFYDIGEWQFYNRALTTIIGNIENINDVEIYYDYFGEINFKLNPTDFNTSYRKLNNRCKESVSFCLNESSTRLEEKKYNAKASFGCSNIGMISISTDGEIAIQPKFGNHSATITVFKP